METSTSVTSEYTEIPENQTAPKTEKTAQIIDLKSFFDGCVDLTKDMINSIKEEEPDCIDAN